jgi:hypothetical protein
VPDAILLPRTISSGSRTTDSGCRSGQDLQQESDGATTGRIEAGRHDALRGRFDPVVAQRLHATGRAEARDRGEPRSREDRGTDVRRMSALMKRDRVDALPSGWTVISATGAAVVCRTYDDLVAANGAPE